jgi:hypothetical protein
VRSEHQFRSSGPDWPKAFPSIPVRRFGLRGEGLGRYAVTRMLAASWSIHLRDTVSQRTSHYTICSYRSAE